MQFYKIIYPLLLLLILSACNKEGKELSFSDSKKSFFKDPEISPSYISATGVWEDKNDPLVDPHSVQIFCDQSLSACYIINTVMRNRGNICDISSDYTEFAIKVWNKNKIIASGYEGLCFYGVLHVDLDEEKIVLKSTLRNNSSRLCSIPNNYPMPIVHTLVDGSNTTEIYYIDIIKKTKK